MARLRRIIVTEGGSPLGRRVIAALRASPDVDHVRGIESRPEARREPDEEAEALDVVSFVPDHRFLSEYLEKGQIDTVIQCGLGSQAAGVDVIGTLCLAAAIGHRGSPVRSWVVASSSAIYPIDSHSPLLQRESQPLPREDETLAASIAEAEAYARDLAQRMTHVNVAILRLQQLVGPGLRGPLATLLGRPYVPSLIGFDPAIQLLHLEDAASAMAFAAIRELAGVYNVASRGLLHWHDALRVTGHASLPFLPFGFAMAEPLLEALGLPFVPVALLDLMRFGHVVDTTKLEREGWRPERDQRSCLSILRDDGRA